MVLARKNRVNLRKLPLERSIYCKIAKSPYFGLKFKK